MSRLKCEINHNYFEFVCTQGIETMKKPYFTRKFDNVMIKVLAVLF